MGRVIAYGLTIAIPVAGILGSFFVGWCAWRLASAITSSVDFSGTCFVVVTIASATAFIFLIWKPLRPAIQRLGAKRE